jgi:hypothetical protein
MIVKRGPAESVPAAQSLAIAVCRSGDYPYRSLGVLPEFGG